MSVGKFNMAEQVLHQTEWGFTQEMHCCGPLDGSATLKLELINGGGGEYLVLHATHLALDSMAEIDALTAVLKKALKESK
ncbi:MAG: hypothetical protein DDT20_00857 [Firmicutes bacterium]|nr:hypothetical protein [Bacillota bacterium]